MILQGIIVDVAKRNGIPAIGPTSIDWSGDGQR